MKMWRKTEKEKKNQEINGKGKTVFMELYVPVIGLGGFDFHYLNWRLNLTSPLKEMFISYNKEKAQIISQQRRYNRIIRNTHFKRRWKRRKERKQVEQIETKQKSGRFRYKYIKNHIKYNGLNGPNTPIKR